ncbi:MAG: S-methyl-5-thioribose-1-phosphate isomerase [Acidobacteria bacterium]|nr:MAG: S-methyl-5-thioribose-1-phosphate isomerase [Acidobacteriota bacterium]
MKINGIHYRTVWMEQSVVKMINQAILPHFFRIEELKTHRDTARAIKDMIVRGAGAIGATAAYGMAQVVLEAPDNSRFLEVVLEGSQTLASTRPTAQNLFYGIERVLSAARRAGSTEEARRKAVEAANLVAEEDVSSCSSIGCHGAALVRDGARVLTHCNAGWLAFVDWGSALAPVYTASREGRSVFVFADETRPWNQGSRLTSFELMNEGISHSIVPDNASGFLMQRGEVDLVIVGADRIAANGDVANKIGTFEKAVVAHELGIPFYVAAPTSTIDRNCPDGSAIPIEERSEDEVLYCGGLLENGEFGRVRLAPPGARARNLAFDVTPAKYITGIITQNGVFAPNEILKALAGKG